MLSWFYFFLSGTLIFTGLLLDKIRRKIFNDTVTWLSYFLIGVAGIINPVLWLLSRPAVYEAAIAGGQFCLMGGLYLILEAFDHPKIRRPLLVFKWDIPIRGRPVRYSLALAAAWSGIIAAILILKNEGLS